MRRIGIGFVVTAMLSELLKERARVFDKLGVCCHGRGGGKEILLMGGEHGSLYTASWRRCVLASSKRPGWHSVGRAVGTVLCFESLSLSLCDVIDS